MNHNIHSLTATLILRTTTEVPASSDTIEIDYFGKKIRGETVTFDEKNPVDWASASTDVNESQSKQLADFLGNLIVQGRSFVTQFTIEFEIYRQRWTIE